MGYFCSRLKRKVFESINCNIMKLKWMLTFAVLALNASLLTAQEKVK